MSTSEFDRQLQEQYDRGGFDYNPASWQNMLQQLDTVQPAKRRKIFIWLPYTGIAASVALIVMLSYFFYTKPKDTVTPVATTKPAAPAITSPTVIAPAATPLTPKTQAMVTTTSQRPVLPPKASQPAAALPASQPVSFKMINDIAYNRKPEPKSIDTMPVATISIPEKKNSFGTAIPLPDDLFMKPKEKEERRTSLNLAGGVNYGSLNTGYALAVNARRKISDKFYVEGDLAFVNNKPQNAAGLSPQQYTIASNGGFTNGVSSVKAANANTSVNTLSYLQFAPTVGYHLFRKLSVGAGADVQRILQNDDTKTVVDANGSVKLVPDLDFGLTAKTEYAITSRLKTGIMYREGLNGLADSKYLNRRYVQMQLKWRLFEK
ncbi:hypothetical protein ACTHGU_20570 [Chitinophagaceae bacterium MMS25-I14]